MSFTARDLEWAKTALAQDAWIKYEHSTGDPRGGVEHEYTQLLLGIPIERLWDDLAMPVCPILDPYLSQILDGRIQIM
jgi:hypothetical protein